MALNIQTLANSLKEFLIKIQSGSYNSRNSTPKDLHKYNNIKLFMAPEKNKAPHFTVKLGISEATFSVEDCTKLSGGLGGDEKYIYRWYDRPTVADKLKQKWEDANK